MLEECVEEIHTQSPVTVSIVGHLNKIWITVEKWKLEAWEPGDPG